MIEYTSVEETDGDVTRLEERSVERQLRESHAVERPTEPWRVNVNLPRALDTVEDRQLLDDVIGRVATAAYEAGVVEGVRRTGQFILTEGWRPLSITSSSTKRIERIDGLITAITEDIRT